MKYYFYNRTNTPTGFRLEPTLEEVFIEPEKYRRFFKPVLAIDISKIFPKEKGELFFLYSTCCIQQSFTFKVIEGKYQLVNYVFSEDSKSSTIEVVEDIPSKMNLDDIPLEDDEFLGDIKMNINSNEEYKGAYLALHELETNLRIEDDDWHDTFAPFRDSIDIKGQRLHYDEGFFGGQPYWLQSFYEEEQEEEEGFVGQINCFGWGNFHDITIYMQLYYDKGEKYIDLTYQMS